MYTVFMRVVSEFHMIGSPTADHTAAFFREFPGGVEPLVQP